MPRVVEVPRHQLPEIDAAAMTAARAVDRLVRDATRIGDDALSGHAAAADRWAGYFQRIPDQLRDEPVGQLRSVARRARAAYGPKDSIRDVFDPEVTEPLLDAIDRLLKAISRYEANRG